MIDEGNTQPMMKEDKRTSYFYKGKEILTAKRAGRPKIYKNPTYFDQETKLDVCTLYCVYGDTKEVARITGIDEKIIKEWKKEPWWYEVQKEVYVAQNENLAAKLNFTLDKALDELNDRLSNGDQTYNPKTGEVTRKPIEARVLASIFDSLAHQRRITRGEPTAITAKVGTEDRLSLLEKHFKEFSQHKIIQGEVINATSEKQEQESF